MAEKTFKLQVIAPERVFYEGEVEFLEFRTTEGDLGIYPKHIAVTVVIAPGVLRIHLPGGELKEAALHSGFAEILSDQVTILAESVEWPDEIDANRAEEARVRAERRIHDADNATDVERAELALKRAILRQNLLKN